MHEQSQQLYDFYFSVRLKRVWSDSKCRRVARVRASSVETAEDVLRDLYHDNFGFENWTVNMVLINHETFENLKETFAEEVA